MPLNKAALEAIQRSLQQFGISIARYPPPDSYQRHIRCILDQQNINCVLDVGGYNGTYASSLREYGFTGLIVSFEPVPASFEQLKTKMSGDPLWVGQPYGLSTESRSTVMTTYTKGDFNSLLDLKPDAESAYNLNTSDRTKIMIELRRLDEVLPDIVHRRCSEPRIFMKLDTQGHDRQVFEGAVGVLDNIQAFQSELPAVRIYDSMPSMPELLNCYSEYGFVPVGFYPVNTFTESMVTPEFDVLFIRFSGQLTARQSS